MPILKIPS